MNGVVVDVVLAGLDGEIGKLLALHDEIDRAIHEWARRNVVTVLAQDARFSTWTVEELAKFAGEVTERRALAYLGKPRSD